MLETQPREDRHQRTERYKIWTKCNDDQRHILNSITASDSSDSGDWIHSPGPEYKPKLFDDPRIPNSSKENMPPLEPAPMSILPLRKENF